MLGAEITTDQQIGQRLRRERERLGLTLVGLADALGVSKSTQIKYEAGETSPSASYLLRAQALGMDAPYVVTGAATTAMAGLAPTRAALLEALDRVEPQVLDALQVLINALASKSTSVEASPAVQQWEVRPDIDLALWRAVALSIPDNPGIDKTARLTPQQFIDIVDRAYEFAKAEAEKARAAQSGATTAINRAKSAEGRK
jgi:transcriptional regulator with XRE-family HTH domain